MLHMDFYEKGMPRNRLRYLRDYFHDLPGALVAPPGAPLTHPGVPPHALRAFPYGPRWILRGRLCLLSCPQRLYPAGVQRKPSSSGSFNRHTERPRAALLRRLGSEGMLEKAGAPIALVAAATLCVVYTSSSQLGGRGSQCKDAPA